MNKKLVCILVSGIFLVTIFSSVNTIPTLGVITKIKGEDPNDYDVVDQKQMTYDSEVSITEEGFAQSFIPWYDTLTRIKLKLNRTGAPPFYEYTLKVYSGPLPDEGPDVFWCRVDIDPITDIPLGTNWVEFDFPDISGFNRYAYKIRLEGSIPTGAPGDVKWCYGNGNPYERGDAFCYKGDWIIYQQGSEADFCFMTYATGKYLNDPPNKPIVWGPSEGIINKEYKFSATYSDPNNDNMHYKINYGDGIITNWSHDSVDNRPPNTTAPYNYTHIYTEYGSYQIFVKAVDYYGMVGEWSDPLLVIVAKSKHFDFTSFQLFIERLIQRFPILNKILNQIIL